ncbi:MAG: ABC transporter permease subunit [Puniceicoccaceae bacterium]|nr:MAG: ABC transporter permease subunit [Puniceicoccaceae bacterium]
MLMRWYVALPVTIAVFTGFLFSMAAMFRPNLRVAMAERPAEEVRQAEERRATPLSPEDPPRIHSPADPPTDLTREPDLLRPLVENGDLPPLRERIGPEPVVLHGPESPGRHGGSFRTLVTGAGALRIIEFHFSGGSLVRWSPQGYPIVPHLAREWTVNEDSTEFVFRLREGLRWSDGHPFTVDDILFWWEHEQNLPGFTGGFNEAMEIGGRVGTIEKIDDLTVRFTFPAPHSLFLERLASWPGHAFVNSPAHFLSRFHPVLGDREEIERLKTRFRIDSDFALYNRIKEWNNPEHPRLWPWVLRTHQSTPPLSFVRNPYFAAVDAEGNQLPYTDRFIVDQKANEMVPVAVAQGEVDFQSGAIGFPQYTVLWDGQATGDYRLLHWYAGARSPFLIMPNLNRRWRPGDTAGEWKHRLLNDRRFRQALSLAIDRERIIRLEFAGVTEPAQAAPGPESPEFYVPGLRDNFTDFDPERANQLLDEIGLTQRDAEGMRTFPDGSRMHFFISISGRGLTDVLQLITFDFAQVGLRFRVIERDDRLFGAEMAGLHYDFGVWSSNNEFFPLLEPRFHVPMQIWSLYAREWAQWYLAGGLYDHPLALEGGHRGPPEDHPLHRAMLLYEDLKTAPDTETRNALMRDILRLAIDEVWTIGVSSSPPTLVAVTNDLRNVPEVVVATWDFLSPRNAYPETFYFRTRTDSPGAIAQMRQELLRVTPWPQAAGPAAVVERSAAERLAGLLRILIWLIPTCLVALVAFRHPFIARRLLILVPTLFIISIVTFVIIELPPGDFLTTRIMELEASGRAADLEEIERLRDMFFLDEAVWQRYLRWTGVYWFFSYSSADTGLLQGQLGRSMATGDPVNQLVGDRILLTVLISLGTILLTWLLAVPIGIYSAVRQYTLTDYVVSILGFIGMSVPGFLLALLLMYYSSRYLGINVSGLFSPEYAAQPEWTWGKFIDLLQHIWLPIVVTGLAGTAGMIRVMRANLLDELGKPYVQTARAKGVRPVRLLLKYPVRLALNPFISGIGGIFPQLVSGGAIVALVLSLPTVGPLLLESLFNQDVYMAGSLLMVLSFLGVLGTLISDLLLLWLDPRIRMEGDVRS